MAQVIRSSDAEPATARGMTVREVMSRDLRVIAPDAAVRTAMQEMRDHGIRHLPVVSPAGGLMGIVSHQDLKHAAFRAALSEQTGWPPAHLLPVRVRDVMTWSVVTAHPHLSLRDAGLLMAERRIGSLPVLDNEQLVGIITQQDLFLSALAHGWMRIDAHDFPW
jgi:acetoin utilization protein AcuB